jgi:hypothetical protein
MNGKPMDGYMRDSQGRLVPVDMVKDLDKLRDQTVKGIVAKALETRDALAKMKEGIREELTAYLTLSAEKYGKKYGGKKGNITLTSFDGSLRLILAVNESISFDERLKIAKHIIDECITRWSEGSRDEIRALVADAFYVDKAGKINTGRILGLRRLNIQDTQWEEAMQAISDSIQIVGSKEHVRIYTRDENGEYKQVPLNIAAF